MSRLPLFPLGMVLFPGLVLPLNVFEDRYTALVRDLLAMPEQDRRFGVVAIREGREVGADGITALYEVGCAARLRQAEAQSDGRWEITTVGDQPFRLEAMYFDRSYLTADVTWLPDEAGDAGEAAVLARAVKGAFGDYLTAVAQAGAGQVRAPELPEEPLLLSHLVGATMLLDLWQRQELLEQSDAVARLRAEVRLLRRETVFLKTLRAIPSPELTRTPASPH